MTSGKAKAFRLFSIAVGLLVLAGGGLWTMRSVITASAEREGDVAELIARVECETCPLADRNRAVWALGQTSYVRDAQVVAPVLQRHLNATPKCDHSKRLCRYELNKAILKIQGKWDLRASLSARHEQ